jgi:hypothetical protein
MAPDYLDVQLDHPVTINGAVVSTLRVRNPSARDVFSARKAAADKDTQQLNLLASLTGWSPDDLLELRAADFVKASETLDSFF